jgi:hypothetical protein
VFIYNEDSSKIRKEIHKNYGKIAAMTWRRLNLQKYVSKYNYIDFRKNFYRNFFIVSSRLFFKEENKRRNKQNFGQQFEKLSRFIKCLPSMKFLMKFMHKLDFESRNSRRDIIFIKLVIEILNHYYRKYDFPLFEVRIWNLLF